MLDVYYTTNKVNSDDFIRFVLRRYYNIPNPTICKSIHGKPYVENSKIHFNLTHSKQMTAIAVGKKRVGLDCESITGKSRPAVLNKFSEREKSEIQSSADFYAHWTARESYIKHIGETLAAYWRKVEFYRGKIYFLGDKSDIPVLQFEIGDYVFSACGYYSKINLRRVEFQT